MTTRIRAYTLIEDSRRVATLELVDGYSRKLFIKGAYGSTLGVTRPSKDDARMLLREWRRLARLNRGWTLDRHVWVEGDENEDDREPSGCFEVGCGDRCVC